MGEVLNQVIHYYASVEIVLLKIQVTVTSLETGIFSEKNINNNVIIFQHVFQTTVLITFISFCLFPNYMGTFQYCLCF